MIYVILYTQVYLYVYEGERVKENIFKPEFNF